MMDVPSDSFYCNVDEIVGTFPTTVAIEILWAAQCSRGDVKRIIAAEEVVTPLKCRKYFFIMQRCTIFTILMNFAFSQPIFILIPATV